MKQQGVRYVVILAALIVISPISPALCASIDLALNTSRTGYPSPLASDPGWGGGTDPWSLVDGQESYASWANGLAFAWDNLEHQATIDFGTVTTFNEVFLWDHGYPSYTPKDTFLDYWNGTSWMPITFSRVVGTMHLDGGGYSDSDIYTFTSVEGSKVRYRFDGYGGDINGNTFVHGWLNEFEVYNDSPEPSSIVLLGTAIIACGIRRFAYRDRR